MPIPKPNYNPPFNITRASHAVLHVSDLARSRAFYVDLIGLIVSDEDKDALYLRGVAEACHHSLVLRRADAPQADRVGLRCFTEEDLQKAKFYFDKADLPAQWAERPYQGRTLHASDPLGTPLEFCASMQTKPRLVVSFERHHGAVPQRIDHFQLLADIGAKVLAEGVERTALILVGRALGAEGFRDSALYDADYRRRFRGGAG